MKEMRRVLALVLCFVMLVGYVPVGALAAEADATAPVETQAVEEVVEAVLGEAVSVSAEQSDSEPAVTEAPAEETEVVEEIVEAVIGPVISASKSEPEETEPATTEAVEETEAAVETYPAETEAEEAELLGEETAYEEAVLAAVDGMLDAAIFCSDVHGSTSDLASVLGGVAGSGVDYSSIGFVGDTCLTVANTESTVNSALGYTPAVMFSYAASHDTENSADISTNWDYSGEVEGVSDYYLVYTIRETDMQTESAAASAAADFTEWAATVDTTKPLFIMTHRPLHERRNGCDGGNEWYEAIQPVAEKMDVVVFWGHNHTGENSVDTDAYYVAKDGDESMTITNGDTIVPNFTYMNAGYINANNQNPARIGVATTVQITDDSLIFQDYNSSGVYEGSYAHNVTVAREFAAADEEEKTISYITINEGNGAAYKQGDTLLFEMLVTYDDGSTVTVTQADCEYTVADALTGEAVELETAMATVGEYAATITYQGVTCGSKLYFTVSEEEDFNGGPTSYDTLSLVIGGATLTADVREATEDESVQTAMGTVENLTDYVAYDISADISAEGEMATVSVPVPVDKAWDTSSLKAYYVADGEVKETIEGTYADGYFTFEVSHFSIYAVGPAGSTTKVELNGSSATVENVEVTTTAKKTVYVLSSTISSGSSYLIVNGNSAGSAYALANNSGSVASTSVTIKSDDTIGTYIELTDAADELWTVGSGYTFKNGSYYIANSSTSLTLSTSSSDWSLSSNRLSKSIRSGRNTYTYYLTGGSSWSLSTSTSRVYFYVPTEIEYETTTTVSGTYTIAGETLNAVVEESGDTATLTGTLTFTPTSGSATTNDVSASDSTTYEVYSDTAGIISGISGNTVTFTGVLGSAIVKVSHTITIGGEDYTVNNYIQVNTVEPYYTIDILDATGVSITKTVIVKGATQMAESHALNLKITKNTSTSSETVTPTADKVTWKVVGYDAEGNRDDTVVTITENADGTGSLKFNKTGTAQITVYYEYADGKSVTDVINVSGSYDNFYTPKDDTADDFPEYPYNGSVRINKTAEAVGAFSQTGMAKVELSMTGVPYGSNVPTDVVVMVDMTASMSDDDVTAAQLAVKQLIESVVYDEAAGTYNENMQLFVNTFMSGSSDSAVTINTFLDNVTISDADELAAAQAEIDGFNQSSQGGGTRYNVALAKVYEILTRDGHADNQFVVFVSDGVATAYSPLTNGAQGTTITGQNSETSSLAAGWFDSTGEVTSSFQTEYYTYVIKTAGIPVYTVGANLTALSDAADLLNHMSSNYSPDGKTSTGETKYSFTCTTSSGITDEVLEIFQSIGEGIRQAAQDVVVEDVVGSDYDLTFKLPNSGISTDETGLTEFYIQVLDYELDPTTHKRTGEYTVLEKFTFNATTGECTGHVVDGSACGTSCSHVTTDGGEITKINGTYFDYTKVYETDENKVKYDVETLTWESDTLDTSELALQYIAYLNNSAGVGADDQVDPGSYYTNEYAHITYTNHIGNLCRKEFPQPQMTWQGAQVNYRFYLVNENGQPVNRAGNVVPFQEATWVTDLVTDSITWNELEEAGEEKILARNLLASANVPGVYSLYDEEAYYEIRVYETEGVDEQAANYNYFIIEGSDQAALNAAHPRKTVTNANIATTKVFNTMQGTHYEAYGAYSQTQYWTDADGNVMVDGNNNPILFTPTSAKSGKTYEPTITDDIDYGNTTVVFAVLWNQSLTPDTVVVDYGLDVVVNVSANDILASGVTGVRGDVPVVNGKDVVMNTGYYTNNNKAKTTEISINDTVIGTATVDSLQTVKFSLNKSTGMLFNDPAVIYYEADCNFYVDDVLNTNTMYTSLTVIPATTVYYEDEYVQLKTYTLNEDTGEYDGAVGWTVNSTAATDIQDVDRPGETANMDAGFDANNVYGYDSAYDNCSTYSLGKAAKASIDASKYATAEFDFYGTGFDVISMTSNTTGTLVVQAFPYNDDGTRATNASKSLAVDTYYGYDYGLYDVTYVYAVDYKTVTVTDENGNTVYKEDGVTPETKTVKYYDWRMTGAAECDSAKEETKDAATATNNSSYVLTEDTLPATAASGDTIIKREMYWKQVNNTNNALYQVPVMKIEGLTYGKYHAVITAAYSEWLDHTPTSNTNGTADGYDLYLDAIRIYNPAGTTYDSGTGDSKIEGDIDDVIQEAYKADNEAWPMYKELRDYIIGENDFNALEDGKQTSAAIFIDQNARTYTISDYKNYGPNNELYLAAGQAVSFVLDLKPYKDANITVADVQIGMKSADGETVNVKLTTIIGGVADSSTATIDTATDRYYRIGDYVDLDGETIIVFENVDKIGTIASITNVKITFKQDPNGVATASDPITEDKESANAVLMLLNAVEEETEPEPEVTLDAELEVNIRKTSVKVGSTVVVKATTSADVAALTVNGTKITKYTENSVTGKRSWTATVKAEEAGDLEVEVIAYSADGDVLETATKTVEVTASKASIAQKTIDSIISKLFR